MNLTVEFEFLTWELDFFCPQRIKYRMGKGCIGGKTSGLFWKIGHRKIRDQGQYVPLFSKSTKWTQFGRLGGNACTSQNFQNGF